MSSPIKVVFKRKAFHNGRRYLPGQYVEFKNEDAPRGIDGKLAHCEEVGASFKPPEGGFVNGGPIQAGSGKIDVKVNAQDRKY